MVKNQNKSIVDEGTQGGMNCDRYGSDRVVSDIEVSIEFLQQVLRGYKVEAIIDEDREIEVREGFGPVVFMRIDSQRHWIIFYTAFSTPTLDAEQRKQFADSLSSSLTMAQFASTADGVGMEYFMYYRGGLNVNQFMAMAQRFGSLAFTAVKHLINFSALPDQSQESVIRIQ